jgi:hypothetical protein
LANETALDVEVISVARTTQLLIETYARWARRNIWRGAGCARCARWSL